MANIEILWTMKDCIGPVRHVMKDRFETSSDGMKTFARGRSIPRTREVTKKFQNQYFISSFDLDELAYFCWLTDLNQKWFWVDFHFWIVSCRFTGK